MLAHHGRLRVQVRDDPAGPAPGEARGEARDGARGEARGGASARKILGLEQGARSDVPAMLGQAATTLTVDLGQFEPDGDRSWTRAVLGLRDRYGPFVLAYLETLVRVADWRASGGRELPG